MAIASKVSIAPTFEDLLLEGLTPAQRDAVRSTRRRVLLVAGAGSGKTEVMARRVAWWVAVDGVPKGEIVAFTFTERAAEEMKFRIRYHMERFTLPDEAVQTAWGKAPAAEGLLVAVGPWLPAAASDRGTQMTSRSTKQFFFDPGGAELLPAPDPHRQRVV
ncbi:hypothetical protein BH20ACT24_BH20ACT24_23130 [soil metagenome]